MLERLSMHVRHGFFGRHGGVSSGVYASLNCGMGLGDDIANVIENRGIACRSIGVDPTQLVLGVQVHSADALIVDKVLPLDETPKVDALVTDKPGLALGIVTADCAPILLCDPAAGSNGVCAAVHAGWRGAVAGVIESAVRCMIELGADASRLRAAIGPCLSKTSFEVGDDLVDVVLDASPWATDLFTQGAGDRSQFDFGAYLAGRLTRLGAAQIEQIGEDTLSQPDRFFSHRHSVQNQQDGCGRNLSLIALLP